MNNKRKPTVIEFANYAFVTKYTGDYEDEITGIVFHYVDGSVKSAKVPKPIFDKIDMFETFRIN